MHSGGRKDRAVSSRSAWFAQGVPGQPEIQNKERLSQKAKQKKLLVEWQF